jgi:hypothetical protein
MLQKESGSYVKDFLFSVFQLISVAADATDN